MAKLNSNCVKIEQIANRVNHSTKFSAERGEREDVTLLELAAQITPLEIR